MRPGRRRGGCGRTTTNLLLQALDLLLELLISILELLNLPRQVADRLLHTVDAGDKFRIGVLGVHRTGAEHAEEPDNET